MVISIFDLICKKYNFLIFDSEQEFVASPATCNVYSSFREENGIFVGLVENI